MEDEESIARAVLRSDPAFEWATVMNDKGEPLAHARTGSKTAGHRVTEQTVSRLGALDSVALAAFRRAEEWYGRMDYVLMAHAKAQVILIRDSRRRLVIAAKTKRSENAEYLYARVKAALKK